MSATKNSLFIYEQEQLLRQANQAIGMAVHEGYLEADEALAMTDEQKLAWYYETQRWDGYYPEEGSL